MAAPSTASLLVTLTLVALMSVAALVIGSIALSKVDNTSPVVVPTVTVSPDVSVSITMSPAVPTNKIQKGSVTIPMPANELMPTAPVAVTWVETFLDQPVVQTAGTHDLSGNSVTLQTSNVTPTGFDVVVQAYPLFNGNKVLTGATGPVVLAMESFTNASGVEVPAIIYEDGKTTTLYYACAKDADGVMWNASVGINAANAYVQGTGQLLSIGGLPLVVYRVDGTQIAVAHGGDIAFATVTSNIKATIANSTLLAAVVVDGTTPKIGAFYTDVAHAVQFITTDSTGGYGTTWSAPVQAIGSAIIVPFALKAAIITNELALPTVMMSTATGNYYFASATVADGSVWAAASSFGLPGNNTYATHLSSVLNAVTSGGQRYVPLLSVSNGGTTSSVLIADDYTAAGVASWTIGNLVGMGNGTSSLGVSLGVTDQLLTAYMETVNHTLRYNLATGSTVSDVNLLAKTVDLDPGHSTYAALIPAIISGKVAFAFVLGTAVYYLRPPVQPAFAISNNFTVTYSAVGLLL